jgi:hypothetical protein
MPQTITCTHAIQVGPTLQRAFSTTFEVDAYDVIEVTVADGAADDQIDVQPGSGVQLLAITTDSYDPPLTYKVNDTANPVFTLDQPQVFAGAGAVGLLAASAPTALFFTNATGQDALVSILVGRDA